MNSVTEENMDVGDGIWTDVSAVRRLFGCVGQ